MSNYKAIIKQKDMNDEWLNLSKEACENAENTFSDEKELASAVKKALETNLKGTWQVVVGRTFGSSLTHEDNCFLYCYVGKHAYLVWRLLDCL